LQLLSCLLWLACLLGCAGGPGAKGTSTDSAELDVERVDYCARADEVAGQVTPLVPTGLIYEIYVRSYRDSDGDGHGDLLGIIEKLDYIDSLGTEVIWLMPIFESPSPAGYDVTDHSVIRAEYGTDDDLVALVDAAAERGMRVIVDTPINHISRSHPWFLAAEADRDAPERAHFVLADKQNDSYRWFRMDSWTFYYAFFGEDFPDLDWTHPDTADAMETLLTDWIALGLGGYRIDAAIQLIEEEGSLGDTVQGHCMLAWLLATLKAENPEAFFLSEAFHRSGDGTLLYLGSEELPEADVVLQAAREDSLFEAMETGLADRLTSELKLEEGTTDALRLSGFIGSHDTYRLVERTDEAGMASLLVATITLPGPPSLYYGDEIGMTTQPHGEIDQGNRAPMLWSEDLHAGFTEGTPWYPVDPEYEDGRTVEAQLADPESTLSRVMGLGTLRRESAALQTGLLQLVNTTQPAVAAYTRTEGDQTVLVALNFSDEDLKGVGLQDFDGSELFVDLRDDGQPVEDPTTVDLEAHGHAVWATPDLAELTLP